MGAHVRHEAKAAFLLAVRQLSFSGEKESRFISLPVLNFHPKAFCS
ncbi:hypothetical protein ATPR_2662 [Acetobacter tropicalis NBRC 101654]|uniref:Uncharacterized protein n=1 Tax=Acetobacter tropicalis NBRC 101654 TaxID=749388 RepID=F7VH13_9PROT|nr:hypothetical protein ATPR_2662 [Acetobacter tropicalis NBRC 101654]